MKRTNSLVLFANLSCNWTVNNLQLAHIGYPIVSTPSLYCKENRDQIDDLENKGGQNKNLSFLNRMISYWK